MSNKSLMQSQVAAAAATYVERAVAHAEHAEWARRMERVIVPTASVPERDLHTLSHADILECASQEAKQKCFDIRFPQSGPYSILSSRNGRYSLFYSEKGTAGLIDLHTMVPSADLSLRDTIYSGCFLHDHSMFSLAQKSGTFVYDQQGLELHRIPILAGSRQLDFLHRHFLLVSASNNCKLTFFDISIGEAIGTHHLDFGYISKLACCPNTGVAYTGHVNGRVSLHTPLDNGAVALMQIHKSYIRSMKFHDNYLVTLASDGLKVTDIRALGGNFGGVVVNYELPAGGWRDIDVSQKGVVALGGHRSILLFRGLLNGDLNLHTQHFDQHGSNKQMTSDRHELKTIPIDIVPSKEIQVPTKSLPTPCQQICSSGITQNVAFRAYEDIIFQGHDGGFAAYLAVGTGSNIIDTNSVNPFESKDSRRNREIKGLLEKLPPETITLFPEEHGKVVTSEKKRRKLIADGNPWGHGGKAEKKRLRKALSRAKIESQEDLKNFKIDKDPELTADMGSDMEEVVIPDTRDEALKKVIRKRAKRKASRKAGLREQFHWQETVSAVREKLLQDRADELKLHPGTVSSDSETEVNMKRVRKAPSALKRFQK